MINLEFCFCFLEGVGKAPSLPSSLPSPPCNSLKPLDFKNYEVHSQCFSLILVLHNCGPGGNVHSPNVR